MVCSSGKVGAVAGNVDNVGMEVVRSLNSRLPCIFNQKSSSRPSLISGNPWRRLQINYGPTQDRRLTTMSANALSACGCGKSAPANAFSAWLNSCCANALDGPSPSRATYVGLS